MVDSRYNHVMLLFVVTASLLCAFEVEAEADKNVEFPVVHST